jgi:hypothetical protein
MGWNEGQVVILLDPLLLLLVQLRDRKLAYNQWTKIIGWAWVSVSNSAEPTRLRAGVLNNLIRPHLRIVRKVVRRVLLGWVKSIGRRSNRMVIICNSMMMLLLLLIHCSLFVSVSSLQKKVIGSWLDVVKWKTKEKGEKQWLMD